ncbi:MAG: hypothetical protein AB7N24_23240, partial [Dehalococcoidia bacterium]
VESASIQCTITAVTRAGEFEVVCVAALLVVTRAIVADGFAGGYRFRGNWTLHVRTPKKEPRATSCRSEASRPVVGSEF